MAYTPTGDAVFEAAGYTPTGDANFDLSGEFVVGQLGSLVLTGNVAQIVVPEDNDVTGATGTLTLTGNAALVISGLPEVVNGVAGALVLTGNAAQIAATEKNFIVGIAGALTLTGNAASVESSDVAEDDFLDIEWTRDIIYNTSDYDFLDISYSLLAPVLPAAPGLRVYAKITGSAETPPISDLSFSISSLEASLLRGTESYVRVVIPNGISLVPDISARQNGRLVIEIYRLYVDGTERKLREIDINFTEFRFFQGPTSSSVNISGIGVVQFDTEKEITVTSVISRLRQLSGSTPQIALNIDGINMNHINPGDILTYNTDTGAATRVSWSFNAARFIVGATIQ